MGLLSRLLASQYLCEELPTWETTVSIQLSFIAIVQLIVLLSASVANAQTTGRDEVQRAAALAAESREAMAMAKRLREAALAGAAEEFLGTTYNEINAPEHACYALGVMVGRAGAVEHLKFDRSAPVAAKNSTEAHGLRVTAVSLDNFKLAVERVTRLSQEERAIEWNLDCVGKLGIRGPFVRPPDSAFYLLKNSGRVLQVLGPITTGFAARLRQAIEQNAGIQTVALGSGGGSVYEALEAGRYIRAMRLGTVLWNDCLSACPLVFAGGVERAIFSPYPSLGFHKIYTSSGPVPLDSQVYRDITSYLAEMGVSNGFVLSRMLSAEPNQMTYVEGTEDALCLGRLATSIQRIC